MRIRDFITMDTSQQPTARARCKPIEELPAWGRCCETGIKAMTATWANLGIFTVAPFMTMVAKHITCNACGFTIEDRPIVRVVGVPSLAIAPLDFIDIQEGE